MAAGKAPVHIWNSLTFYEGKKPNKRLFKTCPLSTTKVLEIMESKVEWLTVGKGER